jgi:hypothetical protein
VRRFHPFDVYDELVRLLTLGARRWDDRESISASGMSASPPFLVLVRGRPGDGR